MKKILVVLLVLAVAGGVFAQDGSWTLGGAARIGTSFNLSQDLDILGNAGSGYKDWTGINGEFDAAYKWGDGLEAGLNFNTTDWLFARLVGGGERYSFKAETALIKLLGGVVGAKDTETYFNGGTVKRLFGEYNMLNSMVTLQANYASADTNYWNGATTAHDVFRIDGGDVGTYDSVPGGNGFSDTDGHNYFVTNFAFSGIEFGVLIPNVFMVSGKEKFWNGVANPGATADDPAGLNNAFGTGWGLGATKDDDAAKSTNAGRHFDFVEDSLKRTIIGFKFDLSPIAVAAQFNLYNYGAYIGATVGIGDSVTAEFSFQGIFNAEVNNDATTAVAGIGFGYDAGLFNAAFKAGVYYNSEVEGLTIGVKPTFTFKILPDYLAFNLEAGFWFGADEFDWAFMPSFWWNFKGTGANVGYYNGGVDTGFIIRYVMWKDKFNALDVAFRWNF